MPTRWTIFFHPTCDRCGKPAIFDAQSKPEALKMARAAGWRIESVTVCPECRERERK